MLFRGSPLWLWTRVREPMKGRDHEAVERNVCNFYSIFTPQNCGNDPNWRSYFSDGWFNHQLVFISVQEQVYKFFQLFPRMQVDMFLAFFVLNLLNEKSSALWALGGQDLENFRYSLDSDPHPCTPMFSDMRWMCKSMSVFLLRYPYVFETKRKWSKALKSWEGHATSRHRIFV